jgi:hypothetical protein
MIIDRVEFPPLSTIENKVGVIVYGEDVKIKSPVF